MIQVSRIQGHEIYVVSYALWMVVTDFYIKVDYVVYILIPPPPN